MASFHTGVRLEGFHDETSIITFNLKSDVVVADAGKPVALDTSVNGTVKVAGDGERIFGYLESVEIRTVEGTRVGAVAQRFGMSFPIKDADTLAVGDTAVGGGGGTVKKAASGDPKDNIVVSVANGRAVIHKF